MKKVLGFTGFFAVDASLLAKGTTDRLSLLLHLLPGFHVIRCDVLSSPKPAYRERYYREVGTEKAVYGSVLWAKRR